MSSDGQRGPGGISLQAFGIPSPQEGVASQRLSREGTDVYSFCGFLALPEEQACLVFLRAEGRQRGPAWEQEPYHAFHSYPLLAVKPVQRHEDRIPVAIRVVGSLRLRQPW